MHRLLCIGAKMLGQFATLELMITLWLNIFELYACTTTNACGVSARIKRIGLSGIHLSFGFRP